MALWRLFLGGLVAAVPVAAASDAPRFALQPSPGGVTRVDTRTGAISHCAFRDGAWFCEAAAAVNAPDLERTSEALAALAVRVDALSARLDRLGSPEAAAAAAA